MIDFIDIWNRSMTVMIRKVHLDGKSHGKKTIAHAERLPWRHQWVILGTVDQEGSILPVHMVKGEASAYFPFMTKVPSSTGGNSPR